MAALPHPVSTTLRLFKPLLGVALLGAIVVGAIVGAARWLFDTEDGARWLLAHSPGVQVQGWHGALLGPRVGAARLRIEWAGGRQSATLAGFEAEGLDWSWRPSAAAWVGLDAARLSARSVVVDSGPPSGKPLPRPATLEVPLRLRVVDVHIDELQVNKITLRAVSGRVTLGDGPEHRAENVSLQWDRLRVQGSARVGAAAPYALAAEATVVPTGDEFDARVKAGGNLDRIVLDGTLAGRATKSHPAPSADVHAALTPFVAWPLAELSARTQALDLAALAGAAPETRLSGRVLVQTSAADAPVAAAIEMDNALPGRWNERRLPVQHLQITLATRAGERERVELRDFDLALAAGNQPAGRLRGRGEWRGHELTLETTLTDVRPQRLDTRAAAMALSGPLGIKLGGLPSPAPGAAAPPPWALQAKAALEGRLDAAPQPVQLTLEASGSDGRLDLRQLRLQSGAAVAQLNALAQRSGGGEWQVATSGSLAEFDPLPWLPGDAGSAWRQGPHRLNAMWQLDLHVPPPSRNLAPLALAQRVAGSGTLRLQDSVLAGVPLALNLKLEHTPSATAPATLRGEAVLAANRFTIDASGNPAGSGEGDQLHIDVDAPALASLSPLLRLQPGAAAWAPKSGTLKGRFDAQGRWPHLRTEGHAELDKLEAADLSLVRGSANWQLEIDDSGERPLELAADIAGLRLGRQRVDLLHAELHGTLREHRLQLAAALPVAPPAVAEQLLGVPLQAGTRAELQGAGAWLPDGSGGGTWKGRVAQLAVGPWNGKTLEGRASTGWADARDLSAEASFDGHGNLLRLQAAPGRVKLADTTALRWDEVVVDLQGAAPKLSLRAELEAFALAPLLARAQPTVGWKGDLRLGASLDIRAAERFDADIVFERRDGDLLVSDENGSQSLGLTDMRLALAAHDGNWIFTQAFAGRTLGEAAGAVRARTAADRRWPEPEAPIEGVIEARVANLGVWGTWVPPGWRLAGELRTSATVGGRFGAPEYTGQVNGHDIGVRNLLQGVNVTQGQVAIKLEGTSARIEQFTLKGGDGTLKVSGGADFGTAPNAKLRIEAEKFHLLGRIDRQLTTSGKAELALAADRVKLDGGFVVDDALFDLSRRDAPGLDDDVSVRRASEAEKPADSAAAQRPRRDVAVALEVDLGQDLHVRGRGLDARLRGKLRITTPNGRLAINGTVSTADGGTYAAYGQKLDIERGIVAFSGEAGNPRLDILALRPNTDMRVGVQITGNLLTPRARLYAENDMSDTDKLSWLVLGRAPDGLGRTDALLLQRAAVALLAGEDEAPTDAVIHALGLDEVSLGQRDGTGDTRETVISFGKQLSRRWYLGYERGVNATTGTWQLVYRIAQRFTLRAQSGQENALDIIWTWKFDEVPLPAVLKNALPPRAPASAPRAP